MNNQNFSGNQNSKGYGGAALILGIVSVIAFPIMLMMPILGLIVSLMAFVLGAISLKSPRKTSAIIGMILGFLTGAYWLFLILSALIMMSAPA